jgi:hypothetical protein
VFRKEDLGLITVANTGLHAFHLNGLQISLTENTWHFFALSVDEHHWTMHASTNGSALVSTYLGDEWNISSMESNRMFIGVNKGWGTNPYRDGYWWDGYTTKDTMDDRPVTGEEATAIYNSSNPTD